MLLAVEARWCCFHCALCLGLNDVRCPLRRMFNSQLRQRLTSYPETEHALPLETHGCCASQIPATARHAGHCLGNRNVFCSVVGLVDLTLKCACSNLSS